LPSAFEQPRPRLVEAAGRLAVAGDHFEPVPGENFRHAAGVEARVGELPHACVGVLADHQCHALRGQGLSGARRQDRNRNRNRLKIQLDHRRNPYPARRRIMADPSAGGKGLALTRNCEGSTKLHGNCADAQVWGEAPAFARQRSRPNPCDEGIKART